MPPPYRFVVTGSIVGHRPGPFRGWVRFSPSDCARRAGIVSDLTAKQITDATVTSRPTRTGASIPLAKIEPADDTDGRLRLTTALFGESVQYRTIPSAGATTIQTLSL